MAELEAKAGKPSVTPAHAAPQQAETPDPMPYTGGVIEAAKAIGSGMAGQIAGGLSGLAGAVLPGPTGQGAEISERVAGAIQYEPKGKAGKIATKIAELPGELISKGADWVGERGSSVPAIGAFGKGSTAALAALIGARSGLKAKPGLTPKQVEAGAARDLGVRLTPGEMQTGPAAQAGASIAGEPRLAKLLSKKNQPVWNNLIAEDLGLEKGTKLSRDVTEDIRAQEGNAYAAMRKAGQVEVDQQYRLDLKATIYDLEGAAVDFEHRATSPLRTVVDSLSKKDSFDANSAVSEIINLRKDAKKAFKQGDTELGRGSLQAAEALENLLDRHVAKLAQVGQMDAGAMEAFKAARVRIAKSYAADKAMDVATGDINPQAYAKMLQARVPLTGGAKQVGEIAEAFPRSAQSTRNVGATGPSFWDAAMAVFHSNLPWPARLALLSGRPTARSVMASRPAQALMDPRTNLSGPAAQALGVTSMPPPPQRQSQ